MILLLALLANKAYSASYVAPPTLSQLITFYASKYNVDENIMRKVVSCESSYRPLAVGDSGKSFGLVQIHLPSHPYVTREQAFDPDFALDFLAKNLAKNKGKMWTCYRMHFGKLSTT